MVWVYLVLKVIAVVVGVGSVIFIHELGHFVAARWAGVLVERFSIGLGPVLLRIRRGETEYAISAIPLGGYVKMLGQTDTPEVEERTDDPRSYQSKSVGKRMVIISAGVVMNLIYGCLLFVLAYRLGVPYPKAVIGVAVPGNPAWEAGIREGDRLLAINGVPRDDYNDIRREVVLTDPKTETVRFRFERPDVDGGATPLDFEVRPFKGAKATTPVVGVLSAHSLVVLWPRDENDASVARPHTPAGQSTELRDGDRVVAVEGKPVASAFEFNRRMFEFRRQPISIEVRREAKKSDATTAKLRLEPNYVRSLGLRMEMGAIESIRADAPAKKAVDAKTREPRPFQNNDVITAVDGASDFDPMRLPDLLVDKAGKPVELQILRGGKTPETLNVLVTPEPIPTWNDFSAFPSLDPEPRLLSAPSIGVAYQVRNTIVRIDPDSPAAKAMVLGDDAAKGVAPALKPGDQIVAVEFTLDVFTPPQTKKQVVAANWPQAFWNLQQNWVSQDVKLHVKRGGAQHQVALKAAPDKSWPLHWRGVEFRDDQGMRQETSVSGAVSRGWQRFRETVLELYLTLRQLGKGNVSATQLSGPLGIFRTLYLLMDRPPGIVVWMLAFLSINLAIVNFLPIPILDGGHMVFLTYELIFRRPPRERFVLVMNYLGIAFLVSLMLFVITLDVLRWCGIL